MKKQLFILLLITSCLPLPSQAQWYRGLAKKARVAKQNLHQTIVKPVGVTPQQVERAVFYAGKSGPASQIVQKAARAMIPLRERHCVRRYCSVNATAFAIEEVYQGKKYLWGVTASHYRYRNPAIPKKRFSYELTPFVAQGHPRANDVSIFRIPESLAGTFEPLKLADHSPEVGDQLFSLSFFDGAFQYTPGRKVIETSPLRFITTLKAEEEIQREGECGSPLINQNGEVTGMVIGASTRRQIGFATTVENIHQILQAYHERETAARPLRINGTEIFRLDVTEAITRIEVLYEGGIKTVHSTLYQEKLLDYDHLETFTDLSRATEIRLKIDRKPFQTEGNAFHIGSVELIHDLKTQTTFINPQF